MISEEDMINRYGAKFFIGQLVRVVKKGFFYNDDLNKVGVIQGISGNKKYGFRYSLWPTETNKVAWFKEDELDFVVQCEKDEWISNGRNLTKKERR